MKSLIWNLLKAIAGRVPARVMLRLSAEAIIRESSSELKAVASAHSREEVWDAAFRRHVSQPLLYIEFGVFQGYSLKHWTNLDQNPASQFIGLDTFTGLPEDWGVLERGTFDVGTNMPRFSDGRVTLIKGLFQDTWDQLARIIDANQHGRQLLVHFDADLYSSTLFVLTRLDDIGLPYLAIFDEFYGDEPRALRDYQSAFQCKVEFLASTVRWNVVLARITPRPR